MCRDLVADSGLVVWDMATPEPPEAVKGHLVVCSEPCAEALRICHPKVETWGSKPIARFASELAIATLTGDEVSRDLAHLARKRWDRNWRVEASAKPGNSKG
jgi:hypothetical protein